MSNIGSVIDDEEQKSNDFEMENKLGERISHIWGIL